MKEEQKYFNHLNQFPIFQNHSVLETIKCKEGNHGIYVCFQKGCQFYPFMCNNKKCSCRKNHENCIKIQVQEFIQKFQKKALNPSSLILLHDKKIDQFIQKMIFESNKIKQQFRDQMLKYTKSISYSPSQLQVLFKIQQSNVESLKGKDFFNVYSQLKLKHKSEGDFDQQRQKQKIQSIWNQFSTKVIEDIKIVNQNWKLNSFYQKQSINKLFYQSKVIQTIQQRSNILQFFTKKIESTTLLYRASQNNFKVAKFHKNCDEIQNTLVIMQAEFGKKIGGFTSLRWKSQKNFQYVVDKQNTSFTFSLTHNQKLAQKQTVSVGIVNVQNYGPMFGKRDWCQFYIGQNSNISNSSGYHFSNCYIHENYAIKNTQTIQRFTGAPNNSQMFKIKEWEVWKINQIYNNFV